MKTNETNLKNLKIKSISRDEILFDDGTVLMSYHDQDCCESHYLYFKYLSMEDVEGMIFDLSTDNFFNRIKDFGIELIPTNNHPLRIPGYGSNNGYYSSNLSLVLINKELDIRKEFYISDCQQITGD